MSTFEKGKIRSPVMARKPPKENMDYVHTLMYGRYTKDLGDYAKQAASKARIEQRRREADQRKRKSISFAFYTDNACCQRCKAFLIKTRDFIFSKVGEDWIFLALLGMSMALCSFAMDYTIEKCQKAHYWLYSELTFSPILQYVAWVTYTLVFVLFSTGFTHIVSPQAIGSGIPEMKTILRGVVLKEYLTFRTLVSKMVGLTTSLGSGLPIGKEGPFVHVASIVATLLSKLVTSFRGIYENESRNSEMLAAACAVGVACTFAAPIGGVLFSIEVTATYFAVRNYWRGFFSAVCGALVFRLLAFWFTEEETITALFKTRLRTEFAFDAIELFAFAIVGLICGFGGALFVYVHRRIIKFMRMHKKLSNFLQKNRFIFPAIVSFFIATITFPLGFGQFMAGHISFKTAINQLFSNFTWSESQEQWLNVEQQEVINTWSNPHTNVFITLTFYIIMQFCMAAIANTLPIAAGVFTPVFAIGAAFGRLIGEAMATWFPDGVHTGDTIYRIVPGGYAVVGAAALSGSVTHTISTAVIVFELTGQITHVLPAVIAVLIANAVANGLSPSIYDSMIQIKRLPYLPDFIPTKSNAHNIFVEDIMVRHIKFISYVATYGELKELLEIGPTLISFPLVDVPESMILLGSIQRPQLEHLLEVQLGRERRLMAKAAAIKKQEEAEAATGSDMEELHVPEMKPLVKKSRFEVTKVTSPAGDNGASKKHARVDVHAKFERGASDLPINPHNTVSLPMRSILKKTPPNPAPITSHKKSHSLSDIVKSRRSSASPHKGEKEPPERIIDMTEDEQEDWEQKQLEMKINFDGCQIDPAPFQLVERTSLHKVHSLFSLLGLSHAYVTNVGRLMGVVALKEVRIALQKTGMNIVEPEVEEYAGQELIKEEADLFSLRMIRSNSQVDKTVVKTEDVNETDV